MSYEGRDRGRGGARGNRGGGQGDPSRGRGRGGDSRGRGQRGGDSRGGGPRGGNFGGDGPRGRGRGDGSRGGNFRAGGQSGGGRGRGASTPTVYELSGGIVPEPDGSITSLEDGSTTSASGSRPKGKKGSQKLPDISKLKLDETFPERPGYGTRGMPVTLWTNYFKLMPQPDSILYRYSVKTTPEATGRKLYRVIQLLIAGPLSGLGSGIASDFANTLICTRRLSPTETDVTVDYLPETQTQDDATPTPIRVKLDLNGTFPVSDLIDHLSGTQASNAFAAKHDITQALNIILGHYPKALPLDQRVSTKSNVHFVVGGSQGRESWDLTKGLQAWRGYFTSIRVATGRLLVNMQVKHAAMYQAGRLDQLMKAFLQENDNDFVRLGSFLAKVRINREHLVQTRRNGTQRNSPPKAILGLATPQDGRTLAHRPQITAYGANANQIKFHIGDNPPNARRGAQALRANELITVHDYFNRVYGINADSKLPAVNIGTRDNPSYLIPEVCSVLPAQASKKKLDPTQTAEMIKFAVRRPFQNIRSITDQGLQDVSLTSRNATLQAFGLVVSPQPLTVKGRILQSPTLRFGKNRSLPTRFGGWNMGDQTTFSRAVTLSRWSCLWLKSANQRDYARKDPWGESSNELRNTMNNFRNILQSTGVNAPECLPPVSVTVDEGRDELNIRDGFRRLIGLKRNEALLLVILPYHSDSIYNLVKTCADIDFGLHTVCVIASKFKKDRNEQYFANVALKFNIKLGGANQLLAKEQRGFIDDAKTMVVGLDVTHPSPGSSEKAPSVAAMVASIGSDISQFPGILSVQESRKEMVVNLVTMLKSRLNLWQKHNQQRLPENILLYRDGVSEGQYSLVIDNELPLLRQACRETYKANVKQPAISIIIAGKRHNTRFYPTTTNPDYMDTRSDNPKNGTVVDRGITEKVYWDFFLQAHTAIQGTARPAHYFVVHDEIFNKQALPPGFKHAGEVLEDITHNMCYMFGRATRAVSLCPPAYYADILCERARCYLAHVFSPVPSQAASVAGSSNAPDDLSSRVRIHENLKDTMFYL